MISRAMVGRTAEAAILHAAVEAVGRGERRLLVIRGEPGIGKSLLLQTLRDMTSRLGYTVLQGHASELESDVPFASMVEALGALLDQSIDPSSQLSAATRWQLYRRLTAGLDGVPGNGPVALIVDDVHWADPVTLEFLEHLVRRPPRKAHLVAVALRPGPAADRLLDAQRMTGGGGTVIDLLSLDRSAAEQLMPSSFGTAECQRIFEESGGNPMFIEELARVGLSTAIPGGVSAYVGVELSRTPPTGLALLRSGAVLGDPFDLDRAGSVAGLSQGESSSAVDDLVMRSLVRGTPDLRLFRFRHPIVRSAVYAAMPPGSRLAAHRRAAEMLTATGAPLPARARHLAHCAAPGDVSAAIVLRSAAAVVRPQAPAIAADWLQAAQIVDPTDDLDVKLRLTEVLVDAGRLLEALTVADEALATVPGHGGGPAGEPMADAALGLVLAAATVERLIGRHAAAQHRLTLALAQQTGDPRTGGGRSAGRLMANLALSAYEGGATNEVGPWARRALANSEVDPLVQAAAAAMLAVTHTFGGRPGDAASAADLAISIVMDASEQDLAVHAELLTAVPWGLIALERLPEALSTGRRTSAAAGRAGNSSAAVAQELAAVLALGLLGRTRECVDAADLAEQSARVTGNDQIVQWALWMRGWALLDRGNVQTALTVAAESLALAERLEESWSAVVARAVYGACLVAAGEPARGRPMIAAYDLDPGWVCRWVSALVEADLLLGEVTTAHHHADRASALARDLGLAGPRAAAARTQAVLALAGDDPRRAHTLALAAFDDAESVGAALESARSQVVAGRALSGIDRKAAIEHLQLARIQADRCGAQRVHDEAVRELRKLGRRVGIGGPRASGIGELGSLSLREREIAELVAQGCTNRDIAGRLFLSEKTVESHLSRTFAKLDVRSRAALAARMSAAHS